MNDLEPWKIWSVTAALVALIFGSTAARVRPMGTGEPAAQASTLQQDQRTPVAANQSTELSDQYDAYSAGYPHGSYRNAETASTQPFMNVSAALLRPISQISGSDDRVDPEPELDVTGQLAEVGESHPDLIAAGTGLLVEYTSAAHLVSDNDSYLSPLDGTDYATNGWIYPTEPTDISSSSYDFISADINGAIELSPTDLSLVQLETKALGNAVVHMVINSGDGNFALNLTQAAGTTGNTLIDRVIALSDDPAGGPTGAAPEVMDELRAQVLDELKAEALVEAMDAEAAAQEERQAALQQVAVYRLTLAQAAVNYDTQNIPW